jgi:hypothetical protein
MLVFKRLGFNRSILNRRCFKVMNATAVILATAFTLSAQAYKYHETNKTISSPSLLKEADRLGLATPLQESSAKQDVKNWKAATVRKRLGVMIPDPLLLEIQAGQTNLEKAKTLARLQLFKGAQKNWGQIKNTSMNDVGAERWEQFEDKIRRDLERIEFSETKDGNNFLFLTPWGFARISKNLTKVSWAIEISRNLDGNRLEEGVEDLYIPEQPRQVAPPPTAVE